MWLMAISTIAAYTSCKKTDNPEKVKLPVNLGAKVTATVSGFITDENNSPVANATVKAGGQSAIADAFGYFSIKAVQLSENAAVVVIEQPGYFKSIKTFIAKEGKGAFVRMKLVKKEIAGTVNGSTGGKVSLANGFSVTLRANGVINAVTKAAYAGTINVAAHFLDPTSTDIIATMPGDLRGINENNQLQLLASFGMAAVELTGSGGELLQVADNTLATLNFPIPSSLQSKAPATIPLWYFDETTGLWVRQGAATKLGNSYVGTVTHFSFWNCDVPMDYVELDCTITDTAGRPMQNVFVKITREDSADMSGGWTDSLGYISGAVPSNSQLRMEVYSDNNCMDAFHSQNISVARSNIPLGTIAVASSNMAIITGSLYDCTGHPVTNGCIIVPSGSYRRVPVTNGVFSYVQNLCNNTTGTSSIVGVDYRGNQQGNNVAINYTAGNNNNVGSFYACGNNAAEFVNYTINGNTYYCAPPVDTILSSPFIHVLSPNSPMHFYMAVDGPVVAGEATNLMYLMINDAAAGMAMYSSFSNGVAGANRTQVHINEYSNGFLSGHFSNTFSSFMRGYDIAADTTIMDYLPYNISCQFRIRY